jgi:hypothetical protein
MKLRILLQEGKMFKTTEYDSFESTAIKPRGYKVITEPSSRLFAREQSINIIKKKSKAPPEAALIPPSPHVHVTSRDVTKFVTESVTEKKEILSMPLQPSR